MSEWHVSASESEGEEGEKRNEDGEVVELGGLRIPASRMVQLLRVKVVQIVVYYVYVRSVTHFNVVLSFLRYLKDMVST